MNPEPAGDGSLLERGLRRELQEELVLDHVPPVELLGFINDDANAVGSVHFGVAFHLAVDDPVGIREKDRPSILRSVPAVRSATPQFSWRYPLMVPYQHISRM